MRILFLVLLLILNVYAEAKGSGSTRSQTKKAKSTVVVKKKAASKSKSSNSATSNRAASSVEASNNTASDSAASNFANPAISTTSVTETPDVTVVRDTVVDTVYVVVPDSSASNPEKPRYNVPLPRQSAFLGEGFSVGIGAGLFNASKDCDCLGVWQGQLEYHYREYIFGGIDVRFFGGTLDQDVMLMYQRYRFNVRYHRGFSGADFYASALFGLETTDLSEFRKELHEGFHGSHSSDSSGVVKNLGNEPLDEESTEESSDENAEKELAEDKPKNCEKMFSLDGFTLGFEAGMGLVLFRYVGLVASATYEFNLSWKQLVSFSSGLAFNLHEIWPWAGENLRSTWISFEMVFQRYFNRGVKEWAVAGFLGFQFGI